MAGVKGKSRRRRIAFIIIALLMIAAVAMALLARPAWLSSRTRAAGTPLKTPLAISPVPLTNTNFDLLAAASTGDDEQVRELIQCLAVINTRFSIDLAERSMIASRIPELAPATQPTLHFTPLHFAIANGHTSTAAILLEHGADPNMVSARGTPLQLAVQNNDAEAIKLLVRWGAAMDSLAQTVMASYEPVAMRQLLDDEVSRCERAKLDWVEQGSKDTGILSPGEVQVQLAKPRPTEGFKDDRSLGAEYLERGDFVRALYYFQRNAVGGTLPYRRLASAFEENGMEDEAREANARIVEQDRLETAIAASLRESSSTPSKSR